MKDISIVICGAAGQGIKTVEEALVGVLKMSGYHIFATKEYMSRVRGGQNSSALRISSKRVAAPVDRIDLLIPLNNGAIAHLNERINKTTKIIADSETFDISLVSNPENVILIPFTKIAKEIGNKIYSNIVSVGVIGGIFKADKETAINFINSKFGKKGNEIIEKNIEAYNKGFELGEKLSVENHFEFDIQKQPDVENEILFNGNQAVGLGAIAGGCNFISAYPMSPSTGVLIFLAQHSNEFEIIVDQAEDEIAGINKSIGAWYAGARAIASTSGGGFALMEEGVSLAAMMESPLVIHIAQRPGPATGLPTRTGQEDLNLALYAGHGEFPRIIFAPGTIQEAFYLTQKAFNIADKYQIPVFILTDQYLVDTYYNIPSLDISKINVQKQVIETNENYKRYKYTESSISPRGIPGYGKGLVRADSDEHDEWGHITENMKVTRPKMVEKRFFKKLQLIQDIVEEPSWIGPKDATKLFITWGSNYHVLKESIEFLKKSDVAMVHFHQVYPLPKNINKTLSNGKELYVIEENASGQFANLLKLYGDVSIPLANRILKFNGEPFTVEELTQILEDRL